MLQAQLLVIPALVHGGVLEQGRHRLLRHLQAGGRLFHGRGQALQGALQGIQGRQRRRRLGQQFAALRQPLHGGVQAAEAGEMRQRLVRQVMALIEDINAVLRGRQNGAATQGQVRQGQVVVGDDDIGVLQGVAGLEETALADIGTAPAAALAVIGGDAEPGFLGDSVGPVVAVAIPLAPAQGVDHGVVNRQGVGAAGRAHVIGVQGQQAVAALPQHTVQLRQADIAAPTLGQRETEIQPAVATDIGQVLVDELFLQGDGGGGHHQALVHCPGDGYRRHRVGNRLAGAGAGLDDAHCRRGSRIPGAGNTRQAVGDFRDHLALAPARTQGLALDNGGVGAANLAFQFLAQQGCAAESARESLLTTALA